MVSMGYNVFVVEENGINLNYEIVIQITKWELRFFVYHVGCFCYTVFSRKEMYCFY